MIAQVTYPQRGNHFAHRFCRLLTKLVIAQEIGPDGAWLLSVIAHQEDSKRYSGPVTFYNGQLLSPCGFTSEDTLQRVRKRCMDAGWLHYEPGGKRKPGLYWVVVPDGVDAPDSPIDESSGNTSHRNGAVENAAVSAVGTAVESAIANAADGFTTATVRGKPEGKCGTSIPIPFPNTNTPLPPKGGDGVEVPESGKRSSSNGKPKRQLSKSDLRDTATVLAWLRAKAKRRKLDPDHHETQVRTLATAALAERADRAGYFEACMVNQKWELLRDADILAAKRRLAAHFAPSIPAAVTDLAERMRLPIPEGFNEALEELAHVG